MSRRGSNPVSGLLIGLAIGAVVVAVYRRWAASQALLGPQSRVALPPGSRLPARRGGVAMQTLSTTAIDTMRNLSLALHHGPDGFLAEARRYVDAARAQLDVAIAEGQVAAAQTRKELEERFNAAKENPQSARSAFMS
jgi:hypothetical protein